jgi:hypothetical protein
MDATAVSGSDAVVAAGISAAGDLGDVPMSGSDADVADDISAADGPGDVPMSGSDAVVSDGISAAGDPGDVPMSGSDADVADDISAAGDLGDVPISGSYASGFTYAGVLSHRLTSFMIPYHVTSSTSSSSPSGSTHLLGALDFFRHNPEIMAIIREIKKDDQQTKAILEHVEETNLDLLSLIIKYEEAFQYLLLAGNEDEDGLCVNSRSTSPTPSDVSVGISAAGGSGGVPISGSDASGFTYAGVLADRITSSMIPYRSTSSSSSFGSTRFLWALDLLRDYPEIAAIVEQIKKDGEQIKAILEHFGETNLDLLFLIIKYEEAFQYLLLSGDEDDEPCFDTRSSRAPSPTPTDVADDDRRLPEVTRTLEEELLALADVSEYEKDNIAVDCRMEGLIIDEDAIYHQLAAGDKSEDGPIVDGGSTSPMPSDLSYHDLGFPEGVSTLEQELLALADPSEDDEVEDEACVDSRSSRSTSPELEALATDSEDDEEDEPCVDNGSTRSASPTPSAVSSDDSEGDDQTLEQTIRMMKRKRSDSIESNATKKAKAF